MGSDPLSREAAGGKPLPPNVSDHHRHMTTEHTRRGRVEDQIGKTQARKAKETNHALYASYVFLQRNTTWLIADVLH